MNWVISFVFTLYINSFELNETVLIFFVSTKWRVYSMANGPWMFEHDKPAQLIYEAPTHRTLYMYNNRIHSRICAYALILYKPSFHCMQSNTCRSNDIHSIQPTFVHIFVINASNQKWNIKKIQCFCFPSKYFSFLFFFIFHFFSSVCWVCICRLSNSCYSLMVMLPMSFLLPLLSCSLSDAYRFCSFIAVAIALLLLLLLVLSIIHLFSIPFCALVSINWMHWNILSSSIQHCILHIFTVLYWMKRISFLVYFIHWSDQVPYVFRFDVSDCIAAYWCFTVC